MRLSEMHLITNNDIPQIGSALQLYTVAVFHSVGSKMAEFLELQKTAALNSEYLGRARVEPAPNSEYLPISELRLITHDYGCTIGCQYQKFPDLR